MTQEEFTKGYRSQMVTTEDRLRLEISLLQGEIGALKAAGYELRDEILRLQGLNESLAARVAAQSEVLSRRAEGWGSLEGFLWEIAYNIKLCTEVSECYQVVRKFINEARWECGRKTSVDVLSPGEGADKEGEGGTAPQGDSHQG